MSEILITYPYKKSLLQSRIKGPLKFYLFEFRNFLLEQQQLQEADILKAEQENYNLIM